MKHEIYYKRDGKRIISVKFYAHTVPQLVQKNDDLNEETKAKWTEDVNDSFYNSQMKYCKLFEANELYIRKIE